MSAMTPATPGVYREERAQAPPPVPATGVPAFLGFASRGPVAVGEAFAAWPRLLELLRRPGPPAEPERAALDAAGARARLVHWAGDEPGTGWPSVAHELEAERWPRLEALLRIGRWPQFAARFGAVEGGYLADAVRGFFDNGGAHCYVVRLDPALPALDALRAGLDALAHLDDVDLVCAPDALHPPLEGEKQRLVLRHCDRAGTLFAVLDSLPQASVDAVLEQRAGLVGTNGALYHPWLAPRGRDRAGPFLVPPCGHVAGIYSRTDRLLGVHKAPANEVLEGVLDLGAAVSEAEHARLNEAGVNALRALRGRGLRVWGARTLSSDPAWRYVSVRRTLLTAARWMELALPDAVLEPNGPALWARIRMSLLRYLTELHRRGALAGESPEEAFYVRCDGGTNPPETRDSGRVVAEIGLAPVLPNEFVVVHLIQTAGGVTITGPSGG